MRDILGINPKFKSTFKLQNGRQIRGVIDTPSDRQPPAYQFLHPRRILKVSPTSKVKTGDMITTISGDKYLLLYNGGSEISTTYIYQTFRLVQMTNQFEWFGYNIEVDFVTGIEMGSPKVSKGLIWASMESMRDDRDRALRVRAERYQVVTNAALQINEQLGDYKVEKANNILGVTVAEVQK